MKRIKQLLDRGRDVVKIIEIVCKFYTRSNNKSVANTHLQGKCGKFILKNIEYPIYYVFEWKRKSIEKHNKRKGGNLSTTHLPLLPSF